MSSISILIVLYNKKISQSKTLQTLAGHNLSSISLRVINNGPEFIKPEGELWDNLTSRIDKVEFYNRLENAPLSQLYNQFISENKSFYYVIFDDDTDVTNYKFGNLISLNADLIIPRIYSVDDNSFYYPIEQKEVVASERSVDATKVISISSGLALSSKFIKKFLKFYNTVFDERFVLYGIDTSFFLRLHEISKHQEIDAICSFVLKHSLSRANKNISKFREYERIYDAALTAKYYPNFLAKSEIVKIFLYYMYKFKFIHAYKLVNCYMTGRHPRAKNNDNCL
ncbi:hypothetical protein PIA91_06655 [Klebsiella michiganensis]|uniref:hypothetical protein n=1 Tax=Klebsiella michiganensis TaxID=1134687 RepID=UPI0021C6B581|nr:hypothetical protein [Klebsiella michiganensis]MDD9629271.1 hypothetical protein [Klebsiella michiganensis]MDD9645712.1 hypothetical protein [Klebsiella michiganensis]MDD9659274.1 hypothetical protein [Klebsiella michiganensis]MEB6369381.1 hypothetical protein [Klebsiella michiganensis]UXO80574.1 hypothetical protein N7918_09470 [Klebsiella michiganensis]